MKRIEMITCSRCGRLCDVSITEGMEAFVIQQVCMGCGEIKDSRTVDIGEGFYLDRGVVATDGEEETK